MAIPNLPTSQSPLLSVVVVNFRSWPDVVRLVDSLAPAQGLAEGLFEIIVVDNASPEVVPPSLLEHGPSVRLTLQPDNGGFSAGVNAGWREARGPWLLVLNPDIVAGPDFLSEVEARIEGFGRRIGGPPGVVGFGLRNPDGSRQPSVGAFPGLIRTAWEQLIPRYRRKYQPEWRLRPGPVDWVTGACMLVSCRMMADLGGMDEDFFLYYEEVALCRSAKDRGWGVEYDPSASVVHLHPLQNRPISPKMRAITRHSKLLYFRKHLPAWQFVALCATVRVEAKLREYLSRIRGRAAEARGWRVVGLVERRLRHGVDLRGRAVLELAESLDEATEDAEEPTGPGLIPGSTNSPHVPHRGPHGRRLPPRKDGTSCR